MNPARMLPLLLCAALGGCITSDAIYAVDHAYQQGEVMLDYEKPLDQVVAAAKAEWPLLTKNKMFVKKTSKGFPMLTDEDGITVIIRPHPAVAGYTRVGARLSTFAEEKKRPIAEKYLDAIGKRLGITE